MYTNRMDPPNRAGSCTGSWLFPTIWDRHAGHGKPVDWWTMGILIYEMIVGYPPFFDDEPMGVYQKILGGRIVFPKFFDKYARQLVHQVHERSGWYIENAAGWRILKAQELLQVVTPFQER